MFILWYVMSLVCILLSILLHDSFELFKFVIGFGFLGAFDMLVCNIIVRLKKHTDYEEWTMKFNDRMSNMGGDFMSGVVSVALLVGIYFTGACIVNFMLQDSSEDIEKPYDLTYSVAFLFGMLAAILIKMIGGEGYVECSQHNDLYMHWFWLAGIIGKKGRDVADTYNFVFLGRADHSVGNVPLIGISRKNHALLWREE